VKRRTLIKTLGLSSLGISALVRASARTSRPESKTPFITVAHITDVHITEGNNAPDRFSKCLRTIVEKHKPAFFLNGGDSIMDASYADVKRESVTSQWKIWDDCIKASIPGYEIHSCIGNHDTWWSAPSHDDNMYGKPYVVQRLNIPGRYYSFDKGNWHFIILDSNNKNVSIDEEQFLWLEKDLAQLSPSMPVLVMSHYPILGTTQVLVGGGHSDAKQLKSLFYKYRQHVKICLSGHNHLSDKSFYNDVQYCCNGAMSGFWWGKGDGESAGTGYYMETPPGYAILKLFGDGRVENQYYPHGL
jgi:3',5'-cyclic AMP phosphodiesterase CpdA